MNDEVMRAGGECEVGIHKAATGLVELDAVNVNLHRGDGAGHGGAALDVYR